MALQSNFFGSKRDADTPLSRPTTPTGAASVTMPSSSAAGSTAALGGTGGIGGVGGAAGSAASTASFPRDVAQAPAAATAAPLGDAPAKADNPAKLTVGPNIKLKGVEITDCDTLVVEGLVEATMDSRVMVVEEQGAFKGSAQVDFAEIRGRFEGTLNARTRLVIRATGKVTGNVRYGSVVIEEGGQLGGEVHFAAAGGTGAPASGASSSGSASASSASHDDSAGS